MPVCGFVDVYSGFTPPPPPESQRGRGGFGEWVSQAMSPLREKKQLKTCLAMTTLAVWEVAQYCWKHDDDDLTWNMMIMTSVN